MLSNVCSEVLVHQGQSCCRHPCRLGRQLVSGSASVSPLALCFIESSTFHSSSCTRAGVRAVSCDSDVPAEEVRFYQAFCVFLCLHPAGTSTGRAVAAGTIPSPCASQQHKQSSSCPSTEGDVSSSPPLAWTQPSAAANPGAESSLSRSRYGAKSSANPLSSI